MTPPVPWNAVGKDSCWRPGVLQAPPFGRRRPQISATFAGPPRGWIAEALQNAAALSTAEAQRAEALVGAILRAQVGGQFWGDADVSRLPHDHILLRARTLPKAREMVLDALARAEAASLVLSAPASPAMRRFGAVLERRGLHVRLDPAAPTALLERSRELIVEDDTAFALLALALNRPVGSATGGDPAGWGKDLAVTAHAVLVAGAAYRSPFTGQPASCEEIVDILSDWRRVLVRSRRIACCTGVSLWKRPAMARMLHTPERAPTFRRSARQAIRIAQGRGGGVASWSSRTPHGLVSAAAWTETPLFHIEDGFLRSAGLGSDLTPPCSIVVDTRAPHYSPDQVSDLEELLQQTSFDPALVARAERLMAAIVQLGLTKYNLKGTPFDVPASRRLVFVPGQVEDDLSVRMAGAGLAGNYELLARARAMEPDAFILFKPHPDVAAGHRPGALSDAQALRYADQVVHRAATAEILGRVDAVHTLTSLTGFEALLRRREVVVHGQPFYAGWGLTRDLAPLPRRTRRLSLAELVAGAMILYPYYLDIGSGLPCPPEALVARLAAGADRPSLLSRVRKVQGRLRLALNVRREAQA